MYICVIAVLLIVGCCVSVLAADLHLPAMGFGQVGNCELRRADTESNGPSINYRTSSSSLLSFLFIFPIIPLAFPTTSQTSAYYYSAGGAYFH